MEPWQQSSTPHAIRTTQMMTRTPPDTTRKSNLVVNIRGELLANQLRIRVTRDIEFLKRMQRAHELQRQEAVAAGNVPLVGAIADAQEPQPTYLEQAKETMDFVELVAASLVPDEIYSLSVAELRSLLIPSRRYEFENVNFRSGFNGWATP